ncbi:MAG TPA: DNA polymerase III subunit gamma/tau, partial [Baekduia sp.]|nr:DNA polymerase III subunit gamma/tau [Baekduia sp.]
MSAGPSLYRRHRPRSFADVVGQEHIVRTLRNAVAQGAVHHAYLFVGSRGTGKTSMAKILASCLNCVDGPTVEPCGRCDSCVSIANASSMDVVEMDAASNNSVDDIRDLRESVQFAPVTGKHKVYILDEAHMLSPQAWNAFLKTLEEPPPNTIFVLATTEAHKVMPTVVDRCHRFDFTRPTVEQLASVVQRVAQHEGIAIGPDAVALVARHATGSFRDALGTLEQLVTYAGREIALDDVLAVLGVADDDLLFGAVDAVAGGDAAEALRAVARLADSGRDMGQFARDLEGHAREVLVVQTLGEVPAQLHLTDDRDARLLAQARAVRGGDVVRLLDLLATGMRLTRDGADARTQLELALVKAAAPEVDGSTRALLSRIERLEAALAAGGAPVAPSSPAAVAAPPAPPAAPPPAPASGSRPEPAP